MASLCTSLIAVGLAILIYAAIGLPLALRVAPRPMALMLAPALGFAVHSALALPLFFTIGLSQGTAILVFAVPMLAAVAALVKDRAWQGEAMLSRVTLLALALAACLAFVIMAAVLPKLSAGGVTLASPIFDHSKIAMIDEMARLGVPPGNPFFGGEEPARLSYYYLWHFSAAELSVLFDISGWEADAALSFFTGFATLAVTIGLAVWLSGRAASALWVVALAATGSLRPVLNALFGADAIDRIAGYPSGFGGWLFQASWAPQHAASAMAALLSLLLLVQLAKRPNVLAALLLALTMAAGFESSTWVGGVAFPLAAFPVALYLLARAAPLQRLRILIGFAAAALLALLLISPFVYDQVQMAALRGGQAPIAIEPMEILHADIVARFGAWLDWPVFWLVFLPVELPAIYMTGLVALVVIVKNRSSGDERRTLAIVFALTIAASLMASWLLVSTLGDNNDLGWRAALPGQLLLIVFAAAGLSRLTFKLSPLPIAAIALVLLAVPGGVSIAIRNMAGTPGEADKAFAQTPPLWQAVRRVTPEADRIASNPSHMEKMTPWPANISWALLADRRSCYAGPAFAPFSARPTERQKEIDAQFARVFAGQAVPGDIEALAAQTKCDTAVVTPADGAWANDPFAASALYRLADGTAAWRIYRKN